ncbi:MAG: hypothetical protein H7315_13105 [Herminiimonas sp.]|nr:hypothetical protein [Herminiimonas sp.]
MFWLDSPLALAGAIVSFGCCQSLMLTPINAILLRVVKDELPRVTAAKAIALSRIFDRIGGISGAALAALLSGWFGYQGAVSALGAIVIVLGLGTIPLLRVFPAIGSKA